MITRDLAKKRSSDQIHSYDITLDLSEFQNLEKPTFGSVSTAEITPATSQIVLDLAGEVQGVTVNGQEASFRAADELLYIDGLRAGERNQVQVRALCLYSKTGEGLHRYLDPEDNQCYLYTQYEPADAHRVYACYDQPDMKATWTFHLITPPGLVVLSNQAASQVEQRSDVVVTHFLPTALLSSYITAVIVGPYAQVDGGVWEGKDGQKIQLAAYCRQSLLKYFDYEDVFEVTRAGLDYFHERYQFPFPWGNKYDQVFVPEYNLGAMENPGCVTFNENYISRDQPTLPHRQQRANTILHEMCHMWFGDLVTPSWWDDLWLKESFADHEGTDATAKVTKYRSQWASFAVGRKAWAYRQDQLPTTHPILADIPDTAAAKLNFDGITYAKGAAVLKQLRAYLGEQSFVAGARLYFQRHQFSSTCLEDFLTALEDACGETKLKQWAHDWLATTGPSVISGHFEDSAYLVTQKPCAPDSVALRPHRFNIGQYEDGKLVVKRDVELSQETACVSYLRPRLLTVLNDDDLTYAITRMDQDTWEQVGRQLSDIENPVTRAVIWMAAFNAVADGIASTATFNELVERHLPAESDSSVALDVMNSAYTVLTHFNTDNDQANRLCKLAWDNATKSLEWARFAVDTTLFAQDFEEQLLKLFEGELGPVGPSLKWRILRVLAARGADTQLMMRDLANEDKSGESKVAALAVRYSAPDLNVKQNAWERLCTDTSLSNNQFLALAKAFACPAHDHLRISLAPEFFEVVRSVWQQRSIQMARYFVNLLYPSVSGHEHFHQPAPYLWRPATESLQHPVLDLGEKWLEENTDAPGALRRLMLEGLDEQRRKLWVRSAVFSA